MSNRQHSSGFGPFGRLASASLVLLAVSLLAAATAAAVVPTVTVPATSHVEYTTASVKGTVDTQDEATTYQFQYVDQASFETSGFATATTGLQGSLPASTGGAEEVSGELTGLTAHTVYHLRLLAENADGASEALAASTFETKAAATPQIDSAAPEGVGYTEATLAAEINPRGAATTYRFQYVGAQAFEASAFAGAAETPATALEGNANPDDPARASLSELQPNAKYYFRVIAQNAKGTVTGTPVWLHTYAVRASAPETCPNAAIREAQHSAFLPDCRAYEMVSPPDKNGGDVMPDSQRTHGAVDGNAITFPSLSAFGDTRGAGVAVEYMAIRSQSPAPGDNGWATHAITPPQQPLSAVAVVEAGEPFYEGEFSPDLNRALFHSWSPLGEEADVAAARNLYLRSDLRSPGAGSYQLASPCPLCAEPGGQPLPPVSPILGAREFGASTDFSHIAFEERVDLTGDAPPEPAGCPAKYQACLSRAYEWDNGHLRLAGLVPPGSEASCGGSGKAACVAAAASFPGPGWIPLTRSTRWPVNVVSADGSRLFFTVPTDEAGNVSTEGIASGRVYARIDGTSTTQLDVSERSPSADAYKPATYQMATPNGSRVFFTTAQALTSDAPTGIAQKLYMYDFTADGEGHHLTYLGGGAQPNSHGVSGVIGAGDDGSYVYFITSASGVDATIWEWHNGELFQLGHSKFNEREDTISGQYKAYPSQGRVTPDGRHLLFGVHDGSGFSPGAAQGSCKFEGSEGCREAYIYSADTHEVLCVSCSPSGAPPTTHTDIGHRSDEGGSKTTWHSSRAVSEYGSRVFFSTGEALVPEDTNGAVDAYEWEAPGTGTCTESSPAFAAFDGGCLYLLSSGTSEADSYVMEASPSGRDVFIVTRQRLVGWDADTSYDLYDVRAEGGFPEPPPHQSICLGESSCLPAPASPPRPAPNGSEADLGIPPCPKGTRRVYRHGKIACVRRHRKRRHHHHHHSGANRRPGR